MYVYERQATLYQGIATLLTMVLVLWTVGFHMFTQSAEAANLTSVSDLLTDSEPSGTSVHTITFTTPNGMLVGGLFTVDFPTGFDLSALNIADISMTVGGNATNTGAAAGVGTWGVDVGGDNSITFETPTDAPGEVGSSTELVLAIGQEAGTMITNPSATNTYEIAIGNTPSSATSTIQDGGYARVAIVDNVLVTAEVQTTFTFTISGINVIGAAVNGTSTTGTTSATAIPFGILTSGNIKTLAQRLNVATNAINGYVVTVEQDTQLQSSTGADIDGFADGAWDDTPAPWASPSNNVGNEDTWGHWGLTSTDGTTTRPSGEFGSDEWIAASTTPTIIMGHDDPADGVTEGVGSTTVGYQVEITALQEAGDDYNTTLTYIATPTF